jgi:hypothetical protein
MTSNMFRVPVESRGFGRTLGREEILSDRPLVYAIARAVYAITGADTPFVIANTLMGARFI